MTDAITSMPDDEQFKRYLGDGVYGHFDGYQIWLTTLEGHAIALEAQVMGALKSYETDLIALIQQKRQEASES